MSAVKNHNELEIQKKAAIVAVEGYLDALIASSDPADHGRADKLCYWMKDYMRFLGYEKQFSPKKLRRYKRGEIIKVHLGYNIGSEEGGLHYAVVLDRNNAISNPVITIVPLTSVKSTTDIGSLRPTRVYLGNELFLNLTDKISRIDRELNKKIDELEDMVADGNHKKDELTAKLRIAKSDLDLANKSRREISRLKQGSIALTDQITTISKIRIYDPKTDHDVLSNVKLSDEKLDLIDAAIMKNFLGPKQ